MNFSYTAALVIRWSPNTVNFMLTLWLEKHIGSSLFPSPKHHFLILLVKLCTSSFLHRLVEVFFFFPFFFFRKRLTVIKFYNRCFYFSFKKKWILPIPKDVHSSSVQRGLPYFFHAWQHFSYLEYLFIPNTSNQNWRKYSPTGEWLSFFNCLLRYLDTAMTGTL